MRYSLFAIISSAAFLLFSTGAEAALKIGDPAPEFKMDDINSVPVDPSYYRGNIIVLEWNNPDCPFVNKIYDTMYMPQLQEFAENHNVVWITVNSSGNGEDGYLDQQQARDYTMTNHVGAQHYILDPTGKLGKLYGAKTTPHMFVIDKTGKIAYMGAIDDKPTPDPASVKGAHNYVQAAIENLAAGKPVAITSTQAYGCSIKYAN